MHKSYYKETDIVAAKLSSRTSISMLINNLALEDIVMGNLKVGDAVPLEKYIRELKPCDRYSNIEREETLVGTVIDDNRKIRICQQDYFLDLFYTSHCRLTYCKEIFDDRFCVENGISADLRALYPLFCDIMQTEIEKKPCSIVVEQVQFAPKNADICRFLVAIKKKNLIKGANVTSHLKKVDSLPYFVKRLIVKEKNKYKLAVANAESLLYKISLLAWLFFYKNSHAEQFEQKAIKWLSLHSKALDKWAGV